MEITNIADALSLAAVTKTEADRARWLRTYGPHVGAEQVALSQAYWDEQASRALAQTLADAVAKELIDA